MSICDARREAILTAQAEVQAKPVYLDTETTGLGRWCEIVEISIVDHQGTPLVDTLIRPKGRIPQDVIRIHGITNEMVAGAPTWPEAWPSIQAALDGRRIATYNAAFDRQMMRQSHAKYRLPWDVEDDQFFCVMQLYARFDHWTSLAKAGRACGIRLPNAHRALADALLARALLRHIACCRLE